jgi:SAM-dependent methyltransferase
MPMLDGAAVQYSRKLREEKWRAYSRFFPPRPGERVLDAGVSVLDDLPNENYFLRRYPFRGQVTAVGVTELTTLEPIYPDVTFVRADGRNLPFDDLSFDVVHSNAVIEHVGPAAEQRRFAAELTRVAKQGFVTTPNRWFPFDTHTRLPVFHWLPRPLMIRAYDLFGRPEHGLWLLSVRRFAKLFPREVELRVLLNRIAGWPATISIVFRRR